MHNIISTGSKGNAIIYFSSILVDCGVGYSLLSPYVKQLQIVLLTHSHGDHINLKTLKRLQFERPSLRIGAGEHMRELLTGFKNIDWYKPLTEYIYDEFTINPILLYHDVINFGYKLKKDGKKVFHATDTAHLNGITAPGFDLFCIEANYDHDTAIEMIRQKELRGEFAYEKGAVNSHLSEYQATEFYYANKSENSKLIRLHMSQNYI